VIVSGEVLSVSCGFRVLFFNAFQNGIGLIFSLCEFREITHSRLFSVAENSAAACGILKIDGQSFLGRNPRAGGIQHNDSI
jgi:hypothetical protein